MLFEETVPAGTKSWFHLHHDSDEVTVGGPGTYAFMPRDVQHAWKNSGAETARVLFLYTPAGTGGLLEEEQRTQGTSRSAHDAAELRQRYGWEVVGPNPL